MDERGQHTEDLRRLTPPPDDETRTRRFGNRCLLWGSVIDGATFTASFVAAILSDNNLYTSPAAQFFGIMGLVLGIAAGTTFIALGFMERAWRPTRARQKRDSETLDRLQSRIEAMRFDTDDRFRVVMGHLAALSGRVDANKERLTEIEQCLVAIAEQLPNVLASEHWKGFNAAVREGFADKTGTDGPGRRRPPHIGLAPPANNR